MRSSELHYDLPPERIAQRPVEPRDAARLLVLQRSTGTLEHHRFRDLPELLRPNDCLVLNDTRVVPARFFCRRETGGQIEALFLREQDEFWLALLRPSARLKVGQRLRSTSSDIQFRLVARHERGEWTLAPEPPTRALDWLRHHGETPLPPYIRRDTGPDARDAERYQTIYARHAGAVAAPTAGLHFTPELFGRLDREGVRRAAVTLHVGLGTFAPIEVADLAVHRMHAEWYEASAAALTDLAAARRARGRLVAVGTTATRVLESLPDSFPLPGEGRVEVPTPAGESAISGWTNIFIYPPYRFRHVHALITNFHLPGSTLLALVMAFADPELIRHAYAEAIAQRYRFYSYGDAMLIL